MKNYVETIKEIIKAIVSQVYYIAEKTHSLETCLLVQNVYIVYILIASVSLLANSSWITVSFRGRAFCTWVEMGVGSLSKKIIQISLNSRGRPVVDFTDTDN